jgi:pyruvate dehydrogenase E2 component (dihydrolipoamide acetyltransferase)
VQAANSSKSRFSSLLGSGAFATRERSEPKPQRERRRGNQRQMATIDIKIPDIGDFEDVDVIEVMVKPGDRVNVEQSLITIESEKATMEVPSPQAGIVKEVKVHLGDKVSEGASIVVLEVEGAEAAATAAAPLKEVKTPPKAQASPAEQTAATSAAPKLALVPEKTPEPHPVKKRPDAAAVESASEEPGDESALKPHASPSVRKIARELGVDLQLVKGSGLHGRIFREDLRAFVNSAMKKPKSTGVGLDLLAWPKLDFKRYGEVEIKPLSRIRKIAKANLARNWVMIPHVTQFDEADVTELEAFRNEINAAKSQAGVKVTMLAFILKALVGALTEFPEFNSSLDGDNLILKKYFNLGFAADTAEGLVVPVLHEVDKKGVVQIARETAELAAAARAQKLKPTDIQGACFTVSSLGGIGGTMFTPIINAPEVAILGVSKLTHKPVYRDGGFVPRLILPLSLSYDHRVIDGALAARFTTYLAAMLADMRRALL